MSHLFPIQYPKGANLNLTKMDQGQHRVTIWRNLVVINQLTLHIKFQANQPSGSGEDDVLRLLPYMGIVAILAMRPGPSEQIFNLPLPGRCIWNLT